MDTLTSDVVFRPTSLIIPTALISIGVIGLESHTLMDINAETREEVLEHIDNRLTIDDIGQYLPGLAVYGLNAAGIHGRNNFRDRSIILATSYLLMSSSVLVIKATSNEQRPDGTSYNSFPSGHTATAFMGAEFLYQEFKDRSPLYGIAGYAVAAGVGAFRVRNNRHWATDVIAGAGIGILSTKIAYWFYPWMRSHLFPKAKHPDSQTETLILPYYDGASGGFVWTMGF